MQLSLKIIRDPINSLIYLERYVCTKDYHVLANYSEVSKSYNPQTRNDGFELPLLNFPINLHGDVNSIPNILKSHFPMHPDTVEDLKIKMEEIVQYIKVIPTSSMRTVLVDAKEKKVFLKLSINRYIARSKRKLSSKQIIHGLAVTKDIEKALSEKSMQLKDFAFLPEVAGIVTTIHGEEIGAVVRSVEPYPKNNTDRGYIQFFALYSSDINNPSDEPLLVQLIRHNSVDPLDFTLTKIIEPVIRHFNYFASEKGLLLQAHAQNTLLEINPDFSIGRIIYRDFGSVTIDGEVRTKKRLSDFKNYMINGKDNDRVESSIEYSLRYDEFMTAHSFELIGKILEKNFKVNIIIFKEKIKEIFFNTMTCKDKFPKVQYSIPVELSIGKFKPFVLKEIPDYR